MTTVLQLKQFKQLIWKYYHAHKRTLPWRQTRDPYKILVSEVMLQQTQVSRVEQKYGEFLKAFPSLESLASASTSDVLKVWQGLGYNRRALMLKKCAEVVTFEFGGRFPKDEKTLQKLPGIGPATAGDLRAFAWNEPSVVIETNIRSVFIHHFFPGKEGVRDAELVPLIEQTLDRENPREWLWALFDYGAYLKTTGNNPSRKSAHYAKQSKFVGSARQKRAMVLRAVLSGADTLVRIARSTQLGPDDIRQAVESLKKDGFVSGIKTRLKVNK